MNYIERLSTIFLPTEIDGHPKRPLNIKQRKEEYEYLHWALSAFTDDSSFVPMSDKDGAETKDYIGSFNIWYYYDFDDKIYYKRILTYTEYHTVVTYSYLQQLIRYIARYYNMFHGKVLQILYIEDKNMILSYKDNDIKEIKLTYGTT